MGDILGSPRVRRTDLSSSSSSSSSSGTIMSPVILFILVLIIVIFSISTLIYFLIRFLKRHASTSRVSESETYPETPRSTAFQRQLQYLFNLHDSGLDQAFIDSLPVFVYKEITMGLKEEPFDCAICLCEFTQLDMLRLLPMCSHAFHIGCIDKWLVSSSSCPICRGTLHSPENPISELPREENDVEKRVVFVRLGKFRSSNERGDGVVVTKEEESSSSSSDLGSRRCYSMGSYKYIEADLEMQVALCPGRGGENGNESGIEGRKIGFRSKGESFSVSKIWQWSNNGRFPSSVDFHVT